MSSKRRPCVEDGAPSAARGPSLRPEPGGVRLDAAERVEEVADEVALRLVLVERRDAAGAAGAFNPPID